MSLGRRQRILIIEDEARIRHLIEEALRPLYEVHVACDGEEGLASATTMGADLILLDLRMPKLDGLSVLAKLKADPLTCAIPVVIVSADGETKTLMSGQRAGAADHLIKPFAVQDLRQVIRRQLLREDVPPGQAA
jgi:DNA-binding response OmpR family regulator